MHKLYILLFFFSITSFGQDKMIKGKITLNELPLRGAFITIDGTENIVRSNEDGAYTITAAIGDVINYDYPGAESKEVLVEDVTYILNISLKLKVTELDEVVVEERKKFSDINSKKHYDENKSVLRTSFGMTDLSKAPGMVRYIQKEQINPGASCILDIIRGRLPGAIVTGGCGAGGTVQMRGFNSITRVTYAIYEVDGVIFTDTPLWVIPATIERIAVLSGTALTSKYGTIGSGGVIIINTKNGLFLDSGATKIAGDSLRVKNNLYANDAIKSKSLTSNGSGYLNQLQSSEDLEGAKNIYLKYSESIGKSYFFVLDAVGYFVIDQNLPEFAKEIVADHWEVFEKNPVALKSLAYLYDSLSWFKEANELYLLIFKLRPKYAQSYLDLARSYRQIGNFTKAASLILRYDYLVSEEILKSDEDFSRILDRELNNLLLFQGKELVSSDSQKEYVLEDAFLGTRLVFEWADSEAEFILQFVNPEKRFFSLEHSLESTPEIVKRQKIMGYSTEEHLIDDALKGIWQVNMTYLGNKKLTPTYLKVTIYYSYGTDSQFKEDKFFKLGVKGVNQNLFSLRSGN